MIDNIKAAIEVFQLNIGRTNALIEAMDKIRTSNRLYQMQESVANPHNARLVKEEQDKQLAWIELSCAEHAVISLATAFETYCKELIRELLANYPDFFLAHKSDDSSQIRALIESDEKVSLEKIEETLKLSTRFGCYKFFKGHSIPFLSVEEAEFIEYIFIRRNNFVHDAGRPNQKTNSQLQQISSPVDEKELRTEVKRLRTKLERIVKSLHKRVLASVGT